MRLKGINIFEQHLEKIVAGVFALALLAVLALQFLSGPTTVKLGPNEVPIAEAYPRIATDVAANTDRAILATPKLPDQGQLKSQTERIDNFQSALTKPVAPKEQLIAGLDDAPKYPWKTQDGTTGPSDAPFAELIVPAPIQVVAMPNMSTIDAREVKDSAELAKIVPAAQPYDKASITVEAVFPGAELRKALENDPDAAGPIRALPKNWWENGTHLLAVVLTRQMLKPDGSWSAAERVPAMPGRNVFVDKLDTLKDAESIKAAAKLATEQPDLVRRTPYYEPAVGDKWIAPSLRAAEEAKGADRAQLVKKLLNDLESLDRRIKKLEEDLTKLGGGGGGGGRPGGGGGGRPGGAGGGGGGAPPAPSPGADDARRKSIEAALKRIRDERAKIVEQLRALGEKIPGEPDQPVVDPSKDAKTEAALLDNPSVRVWAHDPFVQRGQTYRYQISVVITNPYFGHSAAMTTAQADKLAKTGVIPSTPSEWTDPVSVDRETYVFFTSALEDDPSTGANARARAEIYQFRWGYWRRGADELEPGDRVSAKIAIPDFSKVLAAAPQPDQPAITPGSGGGGRGAPPPTPSSGPTGGPDTTPAPTDIPKTNVEITTSDLVLGVGHGPQRSTSSTGKTYEVFIRGESGQVRVVQPDQEKQDSVYVRISKSAERGEKDLNPPQEKPRNPTNPNAPNPDRDLPPDPGGRGGGGGGGGGG